MNSLITVSSCGHQRRPGLHNLSPLHPLHRRAHEPTIPQSPRLRRRHLRHLHPSPRPRNMVRNPQHSRKPVEHLGQSNHGNPIPLTAEIQMLWIPECDDASVHHGQSLYRSIGGDESAGMRRAILVICQFPSRQGLHHRFRHRRHRRNAGAGDRLFIEGSQGEGAI